MVGDGMHCHANPSTISLTAPRASRERYLAPGGPRNASIAAQAALWVSGPSRSVQLSPSSCRTEAERWAPLRRCS
jgi:hypothetical protein